MKDDEKPHVHYMPKITMREFHRQYGLCVFRGGSSFQTPSDSFADCHIRRFEFFSISHMYDGCGKLWLAPGCEYEVNPGDCIIITPGTINRYGGDRGKSYFEDSLNFCGPVAEMMMRAGIIKSGVFPMGPVRKILPILDFRADPAIDMQIRANISLQKLLTDIYLYRAKIANDSYPVLDELLRNIRENPEKWWSISEMAEMCNLSCDQMRRVFFRRTGVMPKLYLDRLKLNLAGNMLMQSGCSIAEVAAKFGYTDQYHFSRRFKAVIGMSPKQYRRSRLDIFPQS